YRHLKDICDDYNYSKKIRIKCECSRLLEAFTMISRRGFAIQLLMNAMRQAHADGWFIVFDTLTLADDRLEAFYDNPNALRDDFRDIGRMGHENSHAKQWDYHKKRAEERVSRNAETDIERRMVHVKKEDKSNRRQRDIC